MFFFSPSLSTSDRAHVPRCSVFVPSEREKSFLVHFVSFVNEKEKPPIANSQKPTAKVKKRPARAFWASYFPSFFTYFGKVFSNNCTA